MDRKFTEAELRDPATATGHCGPLKQISVAQLDTAGCVHTYANNDIGLHRIENRTERPAVTLHVYAPPLRKMRVYQEDGRVRVILASPSSACAGVVECCTQSRLGMFDVGAWNEGW